MEYTRVLILVNAAAPRQAHRARRGFIQFNRNRGIAMTQHLRIEDTLEDKRAMRQLALVVACFIAFTAAMAIGVGIALG